MTIGSGTGMMGTRKERFCAQCGASLGFIDSCYYERGDTCGALQCERDALRQDALRYRWLRDNTPDEITDEKWIDEFMSRAALCSHDGKA